MGSYRLAGFLLYITRACVPLDLITVLDQPNRAVRTRMLRGVGGGSCEAPPYPDVCRAWPGCSMVMSGSMTHLPGKVHTQPDRGEG